MILYQYYDGDTLFYIRALQAEIGQRMGILHPCVSRALGKLKAEPGPAVCNGLDPTGASCTPGIHAYCSTCYACPDNAILSNCFHPLALCCNVIVTRNYNGQQVAICRYRNLLHL